VVLDLRGNQGGYLPAVFCIAGQFLKRDTPLLRLTSRSATETVNAPDTGRHEPITLPLVVLMDTQTDSGGLALAAVLRDAGRASLVGASKSRGNGMVRSLVTTPSGSDTFSLPVGTIVRISGAPLADGLQVDVAVPPEADAALLETARQRFAAAPH
jgi:C-terminal processing protease CtpA/Prc